ncbi:MAG: hypothetical protein ACYTXA_00730, partial [Nostoc sp.]
LLICHQKSLKCRYSNGFQTILQVFTRISAQYPAHINAVLSVARRTQIDHLTSCIDSLRQNWVDLYDSLKEKK